MKNKFLKKIFILLAVLSSCFLFASFSPSLDGRAVVVNEGEMPSGLFAKTVGYLPGDTIIVSNVDGTSSVEILVIGSLDASEGVAIMLSPEAASAIGIDKKDNNIVKITKRSDKDERCTGTAVIAKGAEIENEVVDDEKIEETSPENEILPPAEETFTENVQTEESAETEEVLQPTEETFVEEDIPTEDIPTEIESEEVAADELSELENPEETEEVLQPTEETLVEEDIPTEETFTEEEVLPETEETSTEDIPTEIESEEVLADELSELENPEEKEEVLQPTEEAFVEDIPQEETFTEEEVLPETEETPAEDIPTEIESEEVVADELSELENPEETEEVLQPTEESFVEEDIPTEETFTEEEVLPETEETLAEKVPAEEKSDSEEYEAIVLIPVEPEENISSEEKSEEEIVVENLKDETEKSDIKIVESEQKVEKESVIEKYKVESLDELEKGSYYIQIVVLKEESNIQKIVDEYGNNYPITIVPLKSKSAYQVLIGPISMDEYGTVLNRFKSYGYKDAFLRKIK